LVDRLRENDEVVISAMEHHSNIVPWQIVCEQTGAKLRVIPMNDRGELLLEEFEKILAGGPVKIVSVVHLSNSLGTINDVATITKLAHERGAGRHARRRAVGRASPDGRARDRLRFLRVFQPQALRPDGHRRSVRAAGAARGDAAVPGRRGHDRFGHVREDDLRGAAEQVRGGHAAHRGSRRPRGGDRLRFVDRLANAAAYEDELLGYATRRLGEIAGLRIIGTAAKKGSVISFVMEDPPFASHDIGVILDNDGIAVRTGHHCCQPAMDRFRIPSTARASLAMYNTRADVDALAEALEKMTGKARAQAEAKRESAQGAEVKYPKASASSPTVAADALAEDFELLGDAPAKNEYVLDLGAKLPPLFDLLKVATQGQRVPGCMSEVYLVARRVPEDPTRLEFVADADAHIVRGLIAIMQRLFSGQKSGDILAFDVEAFFRRIGLDSFITTQRRNGLAGMVRRIRQLATELS
jgi:cysteine desulfurase/selenocysteine lyase